jgi:hypothetical protein
VPFAGAGRVLAVGIGGGGDCVGACATAVHARSFGASAVVGGLTWERRPVDPLPGPRRLSELVDAPAVLNDAVAMCGPDTTGPGGFTFAEAHLSRALGEQTVLVDVNVGARAVAEGLADAADTLGCDLIALVDVGGDVLAHGDEAGLASPLADAVMFAAGRHLQRAGRRVIGAVFGAGCDAELTPSEVMTRVAEVAARGGWLGTHGLAPDDVSWLESLVAEVPTEASLMALRCARGRIGRQTIRQGRRTVELTPMGAPTFYLDPSVAVATAARLGDAVADAPSLTEANAILHRLGVRSELDYEIDMARATT